MCCAVRAPNENSSDRLNRQNDSAVACYRQAITWNDKMATAHYNLARTYEALDRRQEAIAAYQATKSAQKHGNLLRARWLAP